ncbi:MAG: MFS transporter [Actinomycetota bacterium]|nr:MFS transporter [Actinomycetota bacterium]
MPRAAAGERERFDRSLVVTLTIVMLAAFVQLLDVSIVNVAIPSIQAKLGASSAEIQLIVAGYLMSFAMVLITGARLGDIYGRRWLFVIGMVGFTAASAACGAAPSAVFLVVARVVQGAFSALMFPQVLSVVQVNVPPRHRGRAFGVLGAVIGLATILGPVIGGSLIALNIGGVDWRSIFYVNVPIGIFAVLGALRRVPESRAPDAPRLDLPGAFLATLGVFLLVFPLVQGRQDGWPAWGWAMLGASVPVFAAFALTERRRSAAGRFPIVHASLASDRAFVSGVVFQIVFFGGLSCFFFVSGLYLQEGFGMSPLRAGITMLPFAVGNVIASAASNSLAGRMGVRILSVGTAIVTVGMAATLAVVDAVGVDLHSWELTPVLLLSGLGVGLVIPPVINVVLAGITSKAAGSASGVLSTTQQLGATLGVAFIGVVFFTVLSHSAAPSAALGTARLRAQLTEAKLPAPAVDAVTRGFTVCFDDRMTSVDPSVSPPSCTALERQAAAAPPAVASVVQRAVLDTAEPLATRADFRRALELSLVYELVVYGLAFGLSFTLPRVAPEALGHAEPRQPAVTEAVPV